MKFEKIDITKENINPFQRIGQDWMLISAEREGKVNTMTASWGMMGVFWGKNVVTVGIRPQRFTKEFVDAVISLEPDRVIYVSCNPETLARDLKWFCRAYRVETIRPYDMFPLTGHVETVVLLSHKKAI